MKRFAHLLVLLSPAAFAQNNLNNYNPVNPPPVQQQVVQQSNNSNSGNVSDWVINDDDNINIQTNKQTQGGSNNQNDKEPCPDCQEIKKLKQQHYSPSYTPGSAKKHHFRKFCNKTNKQMKKWFAKSKKKRPDYSCFNW
jgi:hypothetical protein